MTLDILIIIINMQSHCSIGKFMVSSLSIAVQFCHLIMLCVQKKKLSVLNLLSFTAHAPSLLSV